MILTLIHLSFVNKDEGTGISNELHYLVYDNANANDMYCLHIFAIRL